MPPIQYIKVSKNDIKFLEQVAASYRKLSTHLIKNNILTANEIAAVIKKDAM